MDDDSVSITGDTRNNKERDGHIGLTRGQRKSDAAQDEESPTVIASLDLDSAEDRIKPSRQTGWTNGSRKPNHSPQSLLSK